MTKGKSYQRYLAEFKRIALLRASEDGVTDVTVCENLGISTRQEARLDIFDYIECFYNKKRLHSYLDFNSPIDFEDKAKVLNKLSIFMGQDQFAQSRSSVSAYLT